MINREEAKLILEEHLIKESLRQHCLATALIMEKIAEKIGADVQEYYLAGYLHDVDLELVGDDLTIHAKKGVEILQQYDIPQAVLNAILAHNKHKELETNIEKALWIADPVNGLVIASALMRPDKSITTMNLKSLKKKYKSKNFAAGVSREQIEDCQLLGFTLEEYLQLAMDSLSPYETELGLGAGIK
jgi:putative nucleotidyltransferase with HDIG domain